MSSSTDFGIPAAGPPQKLSLTDREQEILSKAWNCMKTQPEIDYVKLAAETGMTNPRSASNAWSALKKKLFTGVPPTPRTKKAAAAALADDDGEAVTPAAKRKRTPAKKKVAPVDDGADDMDIDAEGAGDATPTKKKRAAPRKKATPAKVAPKTEDEPEEAVKEEAVKTETVKEEAASQTESEAEKTKVESVTDEI